MACRRLVRRVRGPSPSQSGQPSRGEPCGSAAATAHERGHPGSRVPGRDRSLLPPRHGLAFSGVARPRPPGGLLQPRPPGGLGARDPRPRRAGERGGAVEPPSGPLVFDDDVRRVGHQGDPERRWWLRARRQGARRRRAHARRSAAQRPADGDYTVLWRVVSDDGHTIAGVTVFGVGAGRPAPTAALTVGNGPTTKDVVSRWLLFAGLLTAVGAAFFRFAVGARAARGSCSARSCSSSSASRACCTTFRSRAASAARWRRSRSSRRSARSSRRSRRCIRCSNRWCSASRSLLLPGPSIAGHALDRGRSPIEVVDDVVHVAAASVWLGGLLALGLSLRAPR